MLLDYPLFTQSPQYLAAIVFLLAAHNDQVSVEFLGCPPSEGLFDPLPNPSG